MEIVKRKLRRLVYKADTKLKEKFFPLTKNGKRIKSMKNVHLNKRCFIIGNGPSLDIEDLDQLKGEITFAFNRIYYIFEKTDWRPTYYCSEDDKTIFKSKDEINNLILANKFFPINFPRDYKINFDNAHYYLFKFRGKNVEPDFADDIVKGIYWGNTVAYTAIQMAVYMGIKEIYLLGVDHTFSKMVNDKGETIIDPSVKDYFSEEYNNDKDELYTPNIERSTRAFTAAKRYADNNGIKIYNASRGGKLEVFERVDFDKIISRKERLIV
ncbi:6-hydroxymethylpterin diphosphokinase MptE-like protein [Mesobacillus jeotgali]|uniref:6-hydroxymethylpterin diphosphokinase MptE-like protein n=1 Tax=Mesobacillus jeotgali TaxID=129985 RepID=UPI001CFDFE44|nr:6-hydroxymethylpterin diphosphokinase MptE-like protein [Mesobacillus jeotgali]